MDKISRTSQDLQPSLLYELQLFSGFTEPPEQYFYITISYISTILPLLLKFVLLSQ